MWWEWRSCHIGWGQCHSISWCFGCLSLFSSWSLAVSLLQKISYWSIASAGWLSVCSFSHSLSSHLLTSGALHSLQPVQPTDFIPSWCSFSSTSFLKFQLTSSQQTPFFLMRFLFSALCSVSLAVWSVDKWSVHKTSNHLWTLLEYPFTRLVKFGIHCLSWLSKAFFILLWLWSLIIWSSTWTTGRNSMMARWISTNLLIWSRKRLK